MKRILYFLPLFFIVAANAQSVFVTISDGINDALLKEKIENTVSGILTEANEAQAAGRSLNFSVLNLPKEVSESMAMLWENVPFVCPDEEVVEHCISTGTGYQIRNIPLLMKPTNPQEFKEDDYQEAVISFDKKGVMQSFYLTISNNLYMQIIRENLDVTDKKRKEEILNYVDRFKTSYNDKNIKFIEQVFSDDALIITGKVIQQRHGDGLTSPKIQYNKQNKQQYLTNLRRAFQNAKYLHVDFDSVDVKRHPTNPNYYGVQVRQRWSSNTYHDEGYVFMLWDFRDEKAPQIHVRTWQPEKIGGKPFPKDEIFSLRDFGNLK